MEIRRKSKAGIFLTHFFMWALFVFVMFFYQPLSWGVDLPDRFWWRQGLQVLLMLSIFYFNYLICVPRLLFRGRSVWFVIWIVSVTIFLSFFANRLAEKALPVRAQIERRLMIKVPRARNAFDGFLFTSGLLVLAVSTSIAALQRWQRDQRRHEELQRQQVTAELAYLKAQINPHFFFNTLNSIYALSFGDVQLAREALHTLSRMMRYLLYETQQNQVGLRGEISFLKDHVSLMKLRLHDHTTVEFAEPELTREWLIAPMLLLPFVENAFKHGVSATTPGKIRIALAIQGNRLAMTVENTIVRSSGVSHESGGGIGLDNTRRRLELLYPEKHTLAIYEDADRGIYVVDLTIELA
ncbi:hypothetical protein GCM10011386_24070 [Parapedobacter defluvii]|uniref:Signal transduction histidine kinase internal region domain-containing protein n=1 Tax=Parapedobacter defluvii TaxID=2045106 RepID=A0ABQ1LZN5_9SPHI|nr:histidine kinase [Parapedobacter defluvii]GGC31236.1 hypothetical protein GCM10011386_24070 [Parapedobacter defluvii]